MTIPPLKRVKVTSGQKLGGWLAKQPEQTQSVMLVTHSNASHADYVSRAQLRDALDDHGWVAGMRYTLSGSLLGHVIYRAEGTHMVPLKPDIPR